MGFFRCSRVFFLVLVARGICTQAMDDVRSPSACGESDCLAFFEHDQTYKELVSHNASREPSLTALVHAAYTGDLSAVVSQVDTEAIKVTTLALRAALRGGQVEIFKALEPFSPEVAIKQALEDVVEYAPAHFLVYFFQSRPFSRFERQKILMHACMRNDLASVRVTLTLGKICATSEIVNKAIEQCNGEDFNLLELLLEGTYAWNDACKGKPSPLWVAIEKGDVRIISCLLDHGANPFSCFNQAGELVDLRGLDTTPEIKNMVCNAQSLQLEYQNAQEQFMSHLCKQDGCCPLL